MTGMGQVWVDLTDLNNWKGHMTGIQRVVYNVAKEYHRNDAAKFFAYNPELGFSEVDFGQISLRFDVIDDDQQAAGTEQGRSLRNRKDLLVSRSKRLTKRTAKLVYRKSPRRARVLAKEIYVKRVVTSKTIVSKGDIQHPFKKGDTILIPGASWHHHTLITDIGYLKTKLDLKIAHIIYDLIPVLFPEYFGQGFGDVYTKHMFNVFAVTDHALAISENTKKDSIAFLNEMKLPKIEVSTFRLGDDPISSKLAGTPPKGVQLSPNEYVHAVGTFEIRKNYLLLYNVWKKALLTGKKLPKLVIVGQPGWLSGDVSLLMNFDMNARKSIVVLHDADDSQLMWLYKNCMFTVYPSFYEGWGLPIAESLNYGKLCLASNTSSMPEIGKSLIDYFDPYDVKECLRLINEYSTNPKMLKEKEQQIKTQYKPAEWAGAYQECKKATDGLSCIC